MVVSVFNQENQKTSDLFDPMVKEKLDKRWGFNFNSLKTFDKQIVI
jgi:hypothetical protein